MRIIVTDSKTTTTTNHSSFHSSPWFENNSPQVFHSDEEEWNRLESQPSMNENRKKKKKKMKKKIGGKEESYNSSDEGDSPLHSYLSQHQTKDHPNKQEEFQQFSEELKKKKGFIIKKMAEDGNCLFRSIADQVYGFSDMHDQVRARCIEYMRAERDHYSQFVTEDFDDYLERKSKNRCFGNNLEIQAIGELFNRPIEIYTFDEMNGGLRVVNIFHQQYSTDNPPIRLSYHNRNHYNSVVDPYNATVGVGLGLPNFEPGLADKKLVKEAITESENSEIEKLLFEESKKQSELEMTEQEIEEAILAATQNEIENTILETSIKEYYESFHKPNKFP